jgi:hypothetical protein
MSRTERFALISGIIGLVADVIAIGTFLVSVADGTVTAPDYQGLTVRSVWKGFLAFALVYGWIIIAWFLVRRIYRRYWATHDRIRWPSYESLRSTHSQVFRRYVGSATVGVVISPLVWFLVYSLLPEGDSLVLGKTMATAFIIPFALAGMALVVWLVLCYGMPLVYTDIETPPY